MITPHIDYPEAATPATKPMLVAQWQLGEGETGEAVDVAAFADKSLQVDGEFSQAHIVIEGSNTGDAYAALDAPITDLLIRQLAPPVRWLRPHVAGGDARTRLRVTLLALRTS